MVKDLIKNLLRLYHIFKFLYKTCKNMLKCIDTCFWDKMLLLYFVVNLNAETCAYRFGRQMHPFLAKETQVAPCLRMSYIIGITFIACFHATKRRRTAIYIKSNQKPYTSYDLSTVTLFKNGCERNKLRKFVWITIMDHI